MSNQDPAIEEKAKELMRLLDKKMKEICRSIYGRPLISVKNKEGKWEAKSIEGNSMT
jgi:hypothetical protein